VRLHESPTYPELYPQYDVEWIDDTALVWYADALWRLGGAVHAGFQTNAVLRSLDYGATWTTVLPHDANPIDRWIPTSGAGFFVFDWAGTQYLYKVGGNHPDGHDVWRTTDGEHWELVAVGPAELSRSLRCYGQLGGNLYAMGGQVDAADPATALNDVWRSSDGGATWVQLPDAPWSPRGGGAANYELPVLHGKIWYLQGGTYGPGAETYVDAYSFDGILWIRETPDMGITAGPGSWPANRGRHWASAVAWDGLLWIANGAQSPYLADLWCSDDGVHWYQISPVPWAAGHADVMCVVPMGIIRAWGCGQEMAIDVIQRVT
jgi:hypothetical protein